LPDSSLQFTFLRHRVCLTEDIFGPSPPPADMSGRQAGRVQPVPRKVPKVGRDLEVQYLKYFYDWEHRRCTPYLPDGVTLTGRHDTGDEGCDWTPFAKESKSELAGIPDFVPSFLCQQLTALLSSITLQSKALLCDLRFSKIPGSGFDMWHEEDPSPVTWFRLGMCIFPETSSEVSTS